MLLSTFLVCYFSASVLAAGKGQPASIKVPLIRRNAKRRAPLSHRNSNSEEAQVRSTTSHHAKRAATVDVHSPIIDSLSLSDDVVFLEAPNVELKIGNSPQKILAFADTGSIDLTVFAPGSLTGPPTLFNPNASSTFTVSNSTLQTQSLNGDGNITSFAGRDTVSFAGVALPNQTFLVATSADLQEAAFYTAVFGLNTNIFNGTSNGPNWLQTAVTSGLLDEPVFAFSPLQMVTDIPFVQTQIALNSTFNTSLPVPLFNNDGQAYLEIGGYDKTRNYTFAPVIAPRKSWNIAIDGFSANGSPIASTNVTAQINTVATQLIFPLGVAENIANGLGGRLLIGAASAPFEGTVVVPCNSDYTFGIIIAGTNFDIDVANLFVDTLDEAGQECVLAINANAPEVDGTVFGNIATIGDPLLQSVWSVFSLTKDAVPDQIGFAPAQNEPLAPVNLAQVAGKATHAGMLALEGLPQSLASETSLASVSSSTAPSASAFSATNSSGRRQRIM